MDLRNLAFKIKWWKDTVHLLSVLSKQLYGNADVHSKFPYIWIPLNPKALLGSYNVLQINIITCDTNTSNLLQINIKLGIKNMFQTLTSV